MISTSKLKPALELALILSLVLTTCNCKDRPFNPALKKAAAVAQVGNQVPIQAPASVVPKPIEVPTTEEPQFPIEPPAIPKSPTSENREKNYGVIVDCGSSGSRAHIFQWDASENDSQSQLEAMPDVDGKPLSKKVSPGLSTFVKEDEAIKYIEPLIEFVKSNVPMDKLPSTSVYFLATAGMRLADDNTQLDIMNAIAENTRVKHGFKNVRSRIITGWEEGLYQWITMKTLTKSYEKPNYGIHEGTSDNNIDGIIEMGGASLQVAFIADEPVIARIDKYITGPVKSQVKLRDIVKNPKNKSALKAVSVSFLGLGSNSIRQTSIDVLLRRSIEAKIKSMKLSNSDEAGMRKGYLSTFVDGQQYMIKDPCTPKGVQYVIKKPQSLAESESKSPEEDSTGATFEVYLVGDGDGATCRRHLHHLIDNIINTRLNCKMEDCASRLLRTLFVPFSLINFVALGDFYWPMQLIDSTGKLNLLEAYTKAEATCNMPYSELLIKYPDANQFDENRLRNQCFKSLWGLTFLEYGLRLTPLDSDNVRIVKSLNDKQLEWTLGAIVANYEIMESHTELPSET